MGILDSLKKLFGGSSEAEAPAEEAPMDAAPEAAPAEKAAPQEGGETQEEQMQ